MFQNCQRGRNQKGLSHAGQKAPSDAHGDDPNAQKRFQEIGAAYGIVGDKEKRAKYDRGEIDEAGNPRGFDPRAHGAGGGFEGNPFGGGGGQNQHFRWSSRGGGGDTAEGFRAEDIFADLFGGLGGGGGRRRPQARKGDDLSIAVTVSFAEAAMAARGASPCPMARRWMCAFRGPERGSADCLRGQGMPGSHGGPNGDILLAVSVAPHPYFTRDGNNIRMDLPVTLKEAVLGGKVPVPTGRLRLAEHSRGSNSGAVLRLKGKGIPAHSSSGGGESTGDLYVRLVISLPEKPDAALKSFAESWKADYDPRSKLR